MAAYELKYTAEEIDGILESVDQKTIYGDATQSEHGLMSTGDKAKLDSLPTSQQINASLSGKVDKVDGKGLSENDYTDEEKASVASAYQKPSSGIPKNDLDQGVQTSLGKADTALQSFTETDPTVPSWAKQPNKPSYNYSEIGNTPDLSGFITKSVNDLTNYYLKSETYTKAEVAALIGAIQQFHYEIYPTLPASGESNVLYLIGPTGSGTDRYEEYVYANNTFTKIGDTSIDLSGYVTTSALNTALADYATTQDLEDAKVFFAEANVTTFAEIQDAIDAGRTVMLKDEDGYVYNFLFDSEYEITFSCSSAEESFIKSYAVYNDDSWDLFEIENYESQENKVESISSSSDDGHYPSAKAVYDIVSTKYTKPLTGIPASDLASGVIPTVPVQDVTVGGTSVVNNGTAVIPAIPDVSGKADKVLVATTEPSGGMLPNVLYQFGELSGNTTFTLATPADNTIANHYYFTFDTPSTAPTITWPTGLTWFGGSAPTISASKHYEISVLNGIAIAMEV